MTSDTSTRDLLAAADLDALYPVLDANRMTAGWHKKRPSLWKEPRTAFRPLHWRYDVGALALDQAGRWMDTELAERRNLLLFNPVGDNDYDTVNTLVAAYQMIKPGEHAKAHRHTPNAMRIILDAAPGCFTVVDGVKLPMRTGDVLLTPSMGWHSHYNIGDANAYWIDVLDVPLVHRLEPMFVEHLPGGTQAETSSPAEHPYAFPLAAMLAKLESVKAERGVKRLRADTADHFKTMAITYCQIAAGAAERTVANTASRVVIVLGGRGTAQVGDQAFAWSRGDVIAVPSWTPHAFEATESALLVEVSDEPALRALGFYREQP
ncbi:MAG: cupin domain-containing protein [Variovorax sp.]|nr:cupin domain-containing protein [Variovorax sp.]